MSEMPSAYIEKWRISRRPHKCCECGGTIFYKERYHYFSGVWDSQGLSYKTCNDCYNLREEISVDCCYDERPCFGELREYVTEGNYKPQLEKFIDNMDKRGKKVEPWFREQLRNCKNK
jgi:hypothetical protein